MLAQDLRIKHIMKIEEFYKVYTGKRINKILLPADVLKDIQEQGNPEYRVGSRWSSQSKLEFNIDANGHVCPSFRPNFDSTGIGYEDAVAAAHWFQVKSSEYLNGL